jgi:hypothetical protein
VTWPHGKTETVGLQAANQVITIKEGAGVIGAVSLRSASR